MASNMQKTPLERLVICEKEARDFGFEWPDIEMILEQTISEVEEIKDAIAHSTREHLQEEIGDLLHCAVSLCRFTGFDIDETIDKTAVKFENRIEALKKIMAEKGLENLHSENMKSKLELWKAAKKYTKPVE